MKFTGLILICASSCLALILPAIGVVQFPKATQTHFAGTEAQTLPASTPVWTQSNSNPANIPIQPNPQWKPASPQRDFLPETIERTPSPFPVAPATQPIYQPTLANVNSQGTATATNPKFGMGIWLLLAPACLIGLALWTFSPNPSGVKPKTTK